MGYAGKIELKEKAQELRQQGKSYNEILQEVHVSKDTISRWCKEIVLDESQKQQLLANKVSGQKKGSLIAAENKSRARITRTIEIRNAAAKDIKELNNRDKFLMGVMLYVAEGTKMDGKGDFTNADSRMISFMSYWLKEYAKIPNERLRGVLWLHEGFNETVAKEFWVKVSEIPLNQFNKTYIVQK